MRPQRLRRFAAALSTAACATTLFFFIATMPGPAAAQAPVLRPCAEELVPAQVLARLNALRAQPRSCGRAGAAPLPPAGALRWDPRLVASARSFAEELAQRDQLSHEGRQARSLRERLRQAGYPMRTGAENLAAGPQRLDEVLADWLASSGHCQNLQAADLVDMGLACVATDGGRYRSFWVLHLGRSRVD